MKLARLQQATTLGLLALAGVSAVVFARRGEPVLAVVVPLAVVFGYALFLALEFIAVALVHGRDPTPRPRIGQLVRAWAGEVLTAPRVFCWRQPFRSHAEPDHLPAHAQGRRGVVLVHGFVCNRGLWNPWLARLRAADVPCIAVDLEPVFGRIEHYVEIIDAAVRRMHRATGVAPLVVAHSMGGLAVRAWLAAAPEAPPVERVITIGTPHRGTWLARFALTANALQMRHEGEWIAALAAREGDARRVPFTCFYSHCDNIVFPPSVATLPGADNRHLEGLAHVHMAFDERVFDEAMRRLAAPAGAAAAVQGLRPRPPA